MSSVTSDFLSFSTTCHYVAPGFGKQHTHRDLFVQRKPSLINVYVWCLSGAYRALMGQETSLAPPGGKCTAVKKVLATLLGLFGSLQWFGARDILHSCLPSIRPWVLCGLLTLSPFRSIMK